MNYEERMTQIREWIPTVMARYDRPNHLAHEKAQLELKDMAEDLNSEIPANLNKDQMDSLLSKTAQQIRKRQRTRTWPTISLVISCCKDSLPRSETTTAPARMAWDEDKHWAAKIKQRDAVPDFYITGNGRAALLGKELVTLEDLEPYERQIEHDRKEAQELEQRKAERRDQFDEEDLKW